MFVQIVQFLQIDMFYKYIVNKISKTYSKSNLYNLKNNIFQPKKYKENAISCSRILIYYWVFFHQ